MTDYLNPVLNNFYDLIFIFDQNGIIVDYLTTGHHNEPMKAPDGLVNNYYKDVLPPQICVEFEKAFSNSKEGAGSVQFDYNIDLNGDTKWFSAVIFRIKSDELSHYIGVVRNISQRMFSEKALKKSEKKYREFFENTQDVFYQTDKKGIITEISPSIERYSGYKRDAIIGKQAQDFYYYPEDRDILLKSLKKHGRVHDLEVRLKTDEDQLVYTSINAHIIFNHDGEEIGIEGHMRDISARKKAEKKLIETNDELQKLNSQKDKLFSVIAHDLRNFVSGSSGLLDLISDEYDTISKEDLFNYFTLLKKNSLNATQLLEDLLRWSKNQFENISTNPESINLKDTIDSIITLVDIPAKEKKIDMHNIISNNLLVYADPNMLETILRNLLNNAIKFSYKGGKITVSAEDQESKIMVMVKDEGVGMSEEVLEKIFNKRINYTSRGTNNEKGSGLGLDLCIDFVEKHGGTLTADSTPGEGSTFKFEMPKKVGERVVKN